MSSKAHGSEHGHGGHDAALEKRKSEALVKLNEEFPEQQIKGPDEAKAREIRMKRPDEVGDIIDNKEFMARFELTEAYNDAMSAEPGPERDQVFIKEFHGWETEKAAADEVSAFYQEGVKAYLKGTELEITMDKADASKPGYVDRGSIEAYLANLGQDLENDGRGQIDNMRNSIARFRANRTAIGNAARKLVEAMREIAPTGVTEYSAVQKYHKELRSAKENMPKSRMDALLKSVTFRRDKGMEKNIMQRLEEAYGIHSMEEVDEALNELEPHMTNVAKLEQMHKNLEDLRTAVMAIANEQDDLQVAVEHAIAKQIAEQEGVPLAFTPEEQAKNPLVTVKNKMKAHRSRKKLEGVRDAGGPDYLAEADKAGSVEKLAAEIRKAIKPEVDKAMMDAAFGAKKFAADLGNIIKANDKEDQALIREQMLEILNDLQGRVPKEKAPAIGFAISQLKSGKI